MIDLVFMTNVQKSGKKKRERDRRKTEVHLIKRYNIRIIKYITDIIIFIFSLIDIHFILHTKIYMRIRF